MGSESIADGRATIDTARSVPSGLTFDEFVMGFWATLRSIESDDVYVNPNIPWDGKRSANLLKAMSDADPDFHAVLTGVDAASEEARHDDIHIRVVRALAGITSDLPAGPRPEDVAFERLLNESSLGDPTRVGSIKK